MQSPNVAHDRRGTMIFGGLLLLLGVGAFILQELGVAPGTAIAEAGWPFFVVIPGALLLLSAFVVTPPRGLGLAIAGSIVTTVGLILLVQNTTGLWETWAYAWALIPAAAGLGMLTYGIFADQSAARSVGLRLAGIGATLFLIGMWFFGPLLAGGQAPVNLDRAWPAVVMVAGGLVLAWALLNPGAPGRHEGPRPPTTLDPL
jgi:hypothetical protein